MKRPLLICAIGVLNLLAGVFCSCHRTVPKVVPGLAADEAFEKTAAETPAIWNLLYDRPAQQWEDCVPLGNGHLGMMTDGGVEQETIVLNDITLWSGAPNDDSNPKAL